MAIADFNTGFDVQAVLVLGALGRIDLQKVIGVDAKPTMKEVVIHPLGEPPIGKYLPGHWEITIEIERANPAADDTMSTIESAFWSGVRVPVGTLYHYINEVDGSTSSYEFSGVSFMLQDAGKAEGDKPIRQVIKCFARTRRRI